MRLCDLFDVTVTQVVDGVSYKMDPAAVMYCWGEDRWYVASMTGLIPIPGGGWHIEIVPRHDPLK